MKTWQITIIGLIIVLIMFYNPELSSEKLTKKVIKSSVNSYSFSVNTALSTPLEKMEMLTGSGWMNYRNQKSHSTITSSNNTFETIIIKEVVFVKESGKWHRQIVGDAWTRDHLIQQRAILKNATNISTQKTNSGWILDVIPNKNDLLKQLNQKRTIQENELKSYSIKYWIDNEYRIIKAQTISLLEINLQGLLTEIRINSTIELFDFDKKYDIAAPD